MGTKPPQTPEIKARRIKAFHLYLDGILGGKRRSTRSIAQELGVTVKAVDYWAKKDQWVERANATLGHEQAVTLAGHRSLQTLIQADFSKHIATLTKIINDEGVVTKDRILGIKEFASIALRLGAIKPDETPQERIAATEFKDELDGPSGRGDDELPSEASLRHLPAPPEHPGSAEHPRTAETSGSGDGGGSAEYSGYASAEASDRSRSEPGSAGDEPTALTDEPAWHPTVPSSTETSFRYASSDSGTDHDLTSGVAPGAESLAYLSTRVDPAYGLTLVLTPKSIRPGSAGDESATVADSASPLGSSPYDPTGRR